MKPLTQSKNTTILRVLIVLELIRPNSTQEQFAIVNAGDLKLFDELSLLGSEHAAVARLNELIETNLVRKDTITVVPAFELAA